MSGVFPPILPIPGEGWRRYPSPLPGDEAPSPEGGEASERQQVRRREWLQDLVDLLTSNHRLIRGVYAELTDPALPPDRRVDLTDVLVAELSRQVAIERRFLVPLVRDRLGDQEADQVLDELAELETEARRFQTRPVVPVEANGRDGLGRRLEALDQQRHDQLYPQLRTVCTGDQLQEAARRARAARHSAPTRPHARIPERPPWSAVTDPVVGATDRIRDELTGRPTEARDID